MQGLQHLGTREGSDPPRIGPGSRDARTQLEQLAVTVWCEPRLGHPSALVALPGQVAAAAGEADYGVFLEIFLSVCSAAVPKQSWWESGLAE